MVSVKSVVWFIKCKFLIARYTYISFKMYFASRKSAAFQYLSPLFFERNLILFLLNRLTCVRTCKINQIEKRRLLNLMKPLFTLLTKHMYVKKRFSLNFIFYGDVILNTFFTIFFLNRMSKFWFIFGYFFVGNLFSIKFLCLLLPGNI